MSNIFSLSGMPADARRAKLDVVTAAMLNGGASSGWLMGRALRPCGPRRPSEGDQVDSAEGSNCASLAA